MIGFLAGKRKELGFDSRQDHSPDVGPTQFPFQRLAWGFSPPEKRPGHKADHSLPSSAEVKKEWSYTSCCTFYVVLN